MFKVFLNTHRCLSRIHGGLPQIDHQSILMHNTSDFNTIENDTDNVESMELELNDHPINGVGHNEFEGHGSLEGDLHVEVDENTVPSTEKSAALFPLNLKERYKLTQAGVDFAVEQIQMIFSQ